MAVGIDLVDYDRRARGAVMAFWGSREQARQKQLEGGTTDPRKRSGVTSVSNMDGFIDLVIELVRANGLADAAIYRRGALLTLPGHFRPTRPWDLLVMNRGRLVAAIGLKSQAGPSIGRTFNQRIEEVIGRAHDVWATYGKGAFGQQPQPFVGCLMLVEDAPQSRAAVRVQSPHFPVSPELQGASYLQRYDVLCQRLVKEQLYTTAAVIASTRTAVTTGEYSELSAMTSLKTFVTSLAGHVAAEAARA